MTKIIVIACAVMASMTLVAQDIIVTNDAKKIEAKILEVSTSEIRYKELDYLDGPIFILRADEINSIIYANGKVVCYNQPKSKEELAQERAQRVEESHQHAVLEQNDIDELERVRQEEATARKQAESTAKQRAESTATANSMGSLFGKAEGVGTTGNPVGVGSIGSGSWSLAGRGINGNLPQPSKDFKQEGTVIVQIRVNAAGQVVDAKVIGGTVSDKQTRQLAIDAARKAKFTEGDGEQVGKITYIFKLN